MTAGPDSAYVVLPTDEQIDAALRVYGRDELIEHGQYKGYPWAWLSIAGARHFGIKEAIRERAGHRCERCRHPYRCGEEGKGDWTPCDELCLHEGPIRFAYGLPKVEAVAPVAELLRLEPGIPIAAFWRILTVHHLTGEKRDCRWWNLAALCQRCHLTVQGRVKMARAFIFEHSDWFKVHAAGWYAWKYLNEEVTRDEALARLDELLALERLA